MLSLRTGQDRACLDKHLAHSAAGSWPGLSWRVSACKPCQQVCSSAVCMPGQQLEAYVALAVHGARVDLKDLRARLQVWQPKLDLQAALVSD